MGEAGLRSSGSTGSVTGAEAAAAAAVAVDFVIGDEKLKNSLRGCLQQREGENLGPAINKPKKRREENERRLFKRRLANGPRSPGGRRRHLIVLLFSLLRPPGHFRRRFPACRRV